MKNKKLLLLSIVAIIMLIITCIIIRKKNIQLDKYSDNENIENETFSFEIQSNEDGSNYLKEGNIMIYIPIGFSVETQEDDTIYWSGMTDSYHTQSDATEEYVISVIRNLDAKKGYEELKSIYLNELSANYNDVKLSNIKMDDKKFTRYEYSNDSYTYNTILISGYCFGMPESNLLCVSIMSKSDCKDLTMQILGKTVYQK